MAALSISALSTATALAPEAWPGDATVYARAVSAVDGETFTLEDGRHVRLAGIAAASALTPVALSEPPPIVRRAHQALQELVAGRAVRLELVEARADRHRRLLAHVYLREGPPEAWIQGILLSQGLARVATTLDTRRLAAEMLALEAKARSEAAGIWTLDFYRILRPEEAAGRIGGFQIVEGLVRDAARVGSRVFLNFGEDWRSDFTVLLDASARQRFRAAGVNVEALNGQRIRVRGWLQSYNGPLIEASHPEEIELLP